MIAIPQRLAASRPGGAVAVVALSAAAVILGLLGMHTIVGGPGSGHHSPSIATPPISTSPVSTSPGAHHDDKHGDSGAAAPASMASSADASGDCGTAPGGHGISGASCVLALTVVPTPSAVAAGFAPHPLAADSGAVDAVPAPASAPPTPPSLHELSISRT